MLNFGSALNKSVSRSRFSSAHLDPTAQENMNEALDLPVGNFDLEHPTGSNKSPDIYAERKSSSRFNLDRSLQKSLRSKLQTPKISHPLSERRSVEDIDHNATISPIPVPREESQLLEGDDE